MVLKGKYFHHLIQQEHFVFEVLGRYINNVNFQDKISTQSGGILVMNQTAHTSPQ